MKDIIAESNALVKGTLIRGNQDTITLLGNEAQAEFAYFTKMMTNLLTQSNSDVNTIICRVIDEMKPIESINKTSFLKDLFKPKMQKLEDSINKYQNALDYMNKMVLQLKLQKAQILKNEKILLEIEERILKALKNFDMSIREGNNFLEEPESKKKDNTVFNIQMEVDDWTIRLNRKLNDLQTTEVVARQSKLQLEYMLNNNKELLEQISTLLISVVPVWEKQITAFIKIQSFNRIQIQRCQSIEKTNQEIGMLRKEIDNKNFNNINANMFDSIQELEVLEKEESSIKSELKEIFASL